MPAATALPELLLGATALVLGACWCSLKAISNVALQIWLSCGAWAT